MLERAYSALKNPKILHWWIKIMYLLLILACILVLFWGGFDILPGLYKALTNSSDLFSIVFALMAGLGTLSLLVIMYAVVYTLAGAQKDFEQLGSVMKLAIRVLGNEKTARRWLDHSTPSLGSKTPREILRTPRGEEMIRNELMRIEYGMF